MLLKSGVGWRQTFFSWSDIFASMEWCLFSFLLLNSLSSTSHTLPFLVWTRVKYLWSDRLCRIAFWKDKIETWPVCPIVAKGWFFYVLMLIQGELSSLNFHYGAIEEFDQQTSQWPWLAISWVAFATKFFYNLYMLENNLAQYFSFYLPSLRVTVEIVVLVLKPDIDIIESQLLVGGLQYGLKL